MTVFRATPLYMIGDSQSLVYGDRIVTGRGDPAPLVVRAVYCALRAGWLADERGVLHETFATALRGAGLALPAGFPLEAVHVSANPHAQAVNQAGGRAAADPPLVLVCGHLDLAQIARDFPHDDFALPADVERYFTIPPVCRTNDSDAASAMEFMTLLHTQLAGFRRGLRAIRAMGFERLGVLSLPPMGLDDRTYAAIAEYTVLPAHPPRLTLRWRYKLVVAMNHALRLICAEQGADFIDRWPEQTTSDGLVHEGVLTDGVHVSSEAADATLTHLARWAEATAPRQTVAPA